MIRMWSLAAAVLGLLSCLTLSLGIHDGSLDSEDFSNEWVVHFDGDRNSAELLALKLGYAIQEEVR